MSNPFQHTTETYFQTPKRLASGGIAKQLRPSSLLLYLTVLEEAQEKTSTVVLLKTSSVLDALGVAPRHLQTAREQLREFNLVASTEVKRGLWSFELLSLHCKRLDNSLIDLDTLSTDEVRSFYLPQLNDYNFVITADGNLISRCPFHHSHKLRERPFHLKLTNDGHGIGVWQCFECLKTGKMVEFERRRTGTTNVEALKQVLAFFMRQREGDPNTPIQTTVPQPSGVGHDYVGMVLDDDEPQAI